MNTVASLQKLGLSESEAAVFLFLTQHGTAKAPEIQTALDLNKVAAYRALNALGDKGLVTTFGDKRVQKYAAEPLQKLLVQYDHNIQELHDARTELNQWISELADQENQLYKERKIQVYEGLEGFRLWNKERLSDDVKIIREFGHNFFWLDIAKTRNAGQAATIEYMHRRIQKNISLRSIFTGSRDIPAHARTRKDYLKQSRYLDMPSVPTLCLSIFGSRFGYYSGDKEVYRGVIINDRLLASMMQLVFDNLWEQAEPVSL
jgi:sugar-specific transcriptional regulator TrmB